MRIIEADCVEAMRGLDESSIDAIVCDPPYGLEFMGKEWDRLDGAKAKSATVVEADAIGGFQDGSGGNAFSRSRVRSDTRRHGGDMLTANRAQQEWHEAWATEALRILKPGGHLLAFGGTRTYHRLACAVEDAGFEIRDSLIWIYGSGFPKSLDVSKAIDKAAGAEREARPDPRWAERYPNGPKGNTGEGAAFGGTGLGRRDEPITTSDPATPEAQQWNGWGTALKPAHEPIVVARKPLAGTVAANVLEHGTGALNVDGCRVGIEPGDEPSAGHRTATFGTQATVPGGDGSGGWEPPGTGRWPANVVLDPEAASELDRQSGELVSGSGRRRPRADDGSGRNTYGYATSGQGADPYERDGDTGGASRFFFTAPTSEGEGTMGLCDASSAAASSPPQSGPDASAPNDAQTEGSREDKPVSDSAAPTTSATPTTSSESVGSDTPTTPSTEPESSLGSRPEKPSPTRSPANPVEPRTPTDTTTTTPSLSTSVGSADAATLESTSSNTAPGARDSSLPIDNTAARFRYCAKASRGERNAGLEGFEERRGGGLQGTHDQSMLTGSGNERNPFNRNVHPTVKPIALMRWLVRLVTPPGGTVLDPFTGSGTTGCAAALEGFEFIGIEREAEYAAIARARIAFWEQFPAGTTVEQALGVEVADRVQRESGQIGLFEEEAA